MLYASLSVIVYFIVRITFEPHLLLVYLVVPISLLLGILHILSHVKVDYKKNTFLSLPVFLALLSNVLFISFAFTSIDFSHLYLLMSKKDFVPPVHTYVVLISITLLDIFLIIFLPSKQNSSKPINW
jgi:hypothetical protein